MKEITLTEKIILTDIKKKRSCLHHYMKKDFGITKCVKCEYKSILYLMPLK